MGSGNLNLKKSFEPRLRHNQARVYDSEQAALRERKKTQERLEEIKRERAEEELRQQLAAASGQEVVERVEWMYQGPSGSEGLAVGGGGGVGTVEEQEAFLLGKRSIDSVILKKDGPLATDSPQQAQGVMAITQKQQEQQPLSLPDTRDLAAKLREDPLMMMKRQEQMALQKHGLGVARPMKVTKPRDRSPHSRHSHRRHDRNDRSRHDRDDDSQHSRHRRRDREADERRDRRSDREDRRGRERDRDDRNGNRDDVEDRGSSRNHDRRERPDQDRRERYDKEDRNGDRRGGRNDGRNGDRKSGDRRDRDRGSRDRSYRRERDRRDKDR